MDLEMLDAFLTAVGSGPEMIQPSEWLPVVWSDSQRSVSPAFADNEQAERILALVLRLQNSIVRTLMDSPTRFKPLLYRPEEGETRQRGQKAAKKDAGPPEASAWCEGYMSGVLLREELWEPIYAGEATRDWLLPIEALAYGDHDPEYLDWVAAKASQHDRRAAYRRGADLPVLARAGPCRALACRAPRPAARGGAQGPAASALNRRY
jgi:uncharacterized protein